MAMMDDAARLVVDGQYGAEIYGFRESDVIDFVQRSGGVTPTPVVTKAPDGAMIVNANGRDDILYG